MESEPWLSELSENDLFEIVCQDPALKGFKPFKESVDQIGNHALPCAIDAGRVKGAMYCKRPYSDRYWDRLKGEFRLLLCTKDKKYTTLRKELNAAAKKSQTIIVSTIAAAMASRFGVAAGVLVPFCALCLIVVSRLGKEAFCITGEITITLHDNKKAQEPPHV